MKRILSILTAAAVTSLLFSSCMKDEKPYPVPGKPVSEGAFELQNGQVRMGEDYETQIYYSFTTGMVKSDAFKSWDICFSTDATNSEMWLNGGKAVLVYPTGVTDYASVVSKNNVASNAWKFDMPTGIAGKSALGLLTSQNHIGEVLIVDGGENLFFKVQVLEATATGYKIKTGPLEATAGSETLLTKDDNYNAIYFSFNNGVVTPEPPKKDWDVLFVRYRTVYYHYNPDGSDLPYLVNGVLTNPYKTKSAGDSTKAYDFYSFGLDDAAKFDIREDRDAIGFDWKTVNINTKQYTVNPKRLYVVEDQNGGLWKLHFVGFYDDQGKGGSPKFEYQRLK